jgi:hypothetical protein
MAQPVWVTPAGSLGTISEGEFYTTPVEADEPPVVLAGSGCIKQNAFFTIAFLQQPSVPFDIGTDVILTGFTPSGYNGSYTVTAATSSSVTIIDPLGTPVTNLTAISGTIGTGFVTLTFNPQSSAPFAVGASVSLTGFVPSSYNTSYVVSAVTTSSVTVISSSTVPIRKFGNISNVVPGTISNTPDNIFYQLIAGNLPSGMQLNTNGIIVGIPQAAATIQGVPSLVSRDITSKFAVRAYNQKIVNGTAIINRLADRTFEITVSGQDIPIFTTPAGLVAQYYDGSLVTDLQIEFTDDDPGDVVSVRLLSGSLPPGLSISSQGLITGYIPPLTSGDGKYTYTFILEITDGTAIGTSAREFSIIVWSRSIMLADTTLITADNTFITADVGPIYVPLLLNTPGSIGTVRNDNWFAYKFDGIDPSGDADVEYVISNQEPGTLPGLVLDPNTGWLYGAIPDLGLTEFTYTFDIQVRKKSQPEYISNPYNFSLSIIGTVDTDVIWITPSDLGTIINGSISTLYVEAVVSGGQTLQYRLVSGSNSNLPQGLDLADNGDIQGRVSFNTFALDSGTTTFDVNSFSSPTTFDMSHTFTVQAYSSDGFVSVTKTFTITVIRLYNEPYDNLYIQAMPPQDDRNLVNSLLQNSEIFQPDLIYRYNDPYFGVAKNITYYHAYGLTASTVLAYVNSLDLNHYWKNLVLGEIKVAQARNAVGEIIYEVVYSQIIDDLVNSQGESVSKEVTLPYPINENLSNEIDTVYPNSLINMRDQVIDSVGQISNVLPLWMTSKQTDGQVLGFTPAWVLAYAKPGKGQQLAYYIAENFGDQLNLVDYEVDRYELDRFLSHNWDSVTDEWVPTPAETTFDVPAEPPITPTFAQWGNYNYEYTVFTPINWVNNSGDPVVWTNNYNGLQTTFDQNSLKFIAPVDMYVGTLPNPQIYDKYLVFPKRNILN